MCLVVLLLGAASVAPGRARAQFPPGALPLRALATGPACTAFWINILDAMKMKDPSRVAWAKNIKYTENNVAMKIGDGVWGTITGLGDYHLRFADPTTGEVGLLRNFRRPGRLRHSRCA